jgi:uncharacterized protein (UPF0332 family)
MNVKDCLKERLLRKIPQDLEKVNSSLETSKSKLDKAKKLLNSSFFNESVLSSYTSMFHAARALLYNDGFQEKSHYAVYVYLNEKYAGKLSPVLINFFYNYQKERHTILYGFSDEVSKEDAETAFFYADDFIIAIKVLLKKV